MRLTLTLILSISTSPLFAQDADLRRRFDYDKTATLDVKEVGVERRGHHYLHYSFAARAAESV